MSFTITNIICFFTAWVVVSLMSLNLINWVKSLVKIAHAMHKIPCTNCIFFVNNPRLKCTVRPAIANTEEAINCYDFQRKIN